jgi:hypothetical protein
VFIDHCDSPSDLDGRNADAALPSRSVISACAPLRAGISREIVLVCAPVQLLGAGTRPAAPGRGAAGIFFRVGVTPVTRISPHPGQ